MNKKLFLLIFLGSAVGLIVCFAVWLIMKLFRMSYAKGFVVTVKPQDSLLIFTIDDRLKSMEIAAGRNTRITKSGRRVALADLKRGNVVDVAYANVAGKDVAEYIAILRDNVSDYYFNEDNRKI